MTIGVGRTYPLSAFFARCCLFHDINDERGHDFGRRSCLAIVYALCIGSALDFALDVVSFAEEGVPVVQDLLVGVVKVVPLRSAICEE